PESRLAVFFFQAEDGIRDFHVTGVQTCALPICAARAANTRIYGCALARLGPATGAGAGCGDVFAGPDRYRLPFWRQESGGRTGRSEERRVGKECRAGSSP